MTVNVTSLVSIFELDNDLEDAADGVHATYKRFGEIS